MKKHKMAGKPVMIESGKLKGRYFKVIEYLVTQYQGKAIEKLAKTKQSLIGPALSRKQPLDDGLVFGILLTQDGTGKGEYTCVHDNELIVAPVSKSEEKRLAIVKPHDPELHAHGKEADDDTGKPSEGNNINTKPGKPEPIGRSVPSAKSTPKVNGPIKK